MNIIFPIIFMTRVWYSVCGEGMGHAVRSDIILSELIKKHDVIITAANRSYPYLKRKYGQKVRKIEGNTYVYKDNSVARIRSALKFFLFLPYQIIVNTFKIIVLITRFRPQVIISDFESGAHYFSIFFRIPCINIDNIHALTECDMNMKKPFYIKPLIKFWHPPSDLYIIPDFNNMVPRNKRKTKLVVPMIKKEITRLKPEDKDFVLVYQTSSTNQKMLPILARTNNLYKVYGMKKKGKTKNIEFKDFSEISFLEDLRTCRYVIVNGGFTVISEALYLKKPILSIPIKHQFEQEFNAYTIKKKGYGSFSKKLTLADIKRFEKNLGHYKKNISKIEKWENVELFEAIESAIKRFSK